MVLENEILSMYEWLLPSFEGWGALIDFALVVVGLAVISLFVAYLRMASLRGPAEGFYAVAKAIATAIASDFPNTTLRRTWAMARLAIQESLRRRVLVGFAVFAVLLLFAGWFLDTKSDHPARLYLSFVLSATEWLILILAVMLTAFSLPDDIKTRRIYTVVTKPIRAGEIVLGRILGFALVNTAILVLMGVVSYVFVVRGLSHPHRIDPEDTDEIRDVSGTLESWQGETSLNDYHRHDFTVDGATRRGRTDMTADHYHEVLALGEGDDVTFEVGSSEGALVAKVPIYGKLRFLDRTGRPGKGITITRS